MYEKLRIGDYVVMNDKYRVSEKNKGHVFVVRSSEYDVGGQPCVFLRHYVGAYAVDGLTKLTEEQAQELLEKRLCVGLAEVMLKCLKCEKNKEWREELSNDETLLLELLDKRENA